jgi:voltage-dependent potassium channel beta subunit
MVEGAPKMQYRYLGNTGLKVSVFGYGNWVNSNSQEEYNTTRDCMKRMHENGVNFFDTAEIYQKGEAEIQLGKAIKENGFRREDIVVSTKLYKYAETPFHPASANDDFLSRKHIIEGMKNSLKRLQLDYVDVVFAHRPDYHTPLEETCRAFHWVIEQGQAFYWGTSEWPADRIAKAIEICNKLNLHRPIVEQPQYNMIARENVEKKLRRIFSEDGYGTTVWSPLMSGILSGKYNEGEIPAGSRFDKEPGLKAIFDSFFAKDPKAAQDKLKALGEYAKTLGYTQAQLALAWVIANKDVSTCLLGFSRVS